MPKRLLGVLLCALLALALIAGPALATEAEAPAPGAGEEEAEAPPNIDEICTEENPVALEFCPEPYEAPSVFRPILPVLLIAGALIALGLFLLYVRWLPNFAQERKVKSKARR
jgi:ABC-type glycerol-3-phosphate transport system substrate-binding protein